LIALIQRVVQARVLVEGSAIGSIAGGILALIGVERGDTPREAEKLAARVLAYRIFPDEGGRMNRSLEQTRGGLLAVPQFTLAADTRSGTRAGFSRAAEPVEGERLFEHFVRAAQASKLDVATGRFGAHMQVELTNDGPVTFWLEARNPGPGAAPSG
jgi:D-tyrosyl-tRNA(Tyr) deacylase